MKKELRITIVGGVIQSIESNFGVDVQILDYDPHSFDSLEFNTRKPDIIREGEQIIFEPQKSGEPCICGKCGSKWSHPETSMCFECGSDNWVELEDCKNVDLKEYVDNACKNLGISKARLMELIVS